MGGGGEIGELTTRASVVLEDVLRRDILSDVGAVAEHLVDSGERGKGWRRGAGGKGDEFAA